MEVQWLGPGPGPGSQSMSPHRPRELLPWGPWGLSQELHLASLTLSEAWGWAVNQLHWAQDSRATGAPGRARAPSSGRLPPEAQGQERGRREAEPGQRTPPRVQRVGQEGLRWEGWKEQGEAGSGRGHSRALICTDPWGWSTCCGLSVGWGVWHQLGMLPSKGQSDSLPGSDNQKSLHTQPDAPG